MATRATGAKGKAAGRTGRPRAVVKRATGAGKAAAEVDKDGKAVETGRACSVVYGETVAKLEVQLKRLGELMDASIEAGEVMAVKNLATAQKEVLNCYSEAARLAQVHGVDEGRLLPIEVLSEYQQEVFPALARALDDLHTALLNQVPAGGRASLERAWAKAYPAFGATMTETMRKLDEHVQRVRGQAVTEVKKSNARRSTLAAHRRKKA